MRRAGLALPALAALVLAGGSFAAPDEYDMAATPTLGPEVLRPAHPVRAATGMLSGDLDHESRRVHWELVYRRLHGQATQADIHYGKPVRRDECPRRQASSRPRVGLQDLA